MKTCIIILICLVVGWTLAEPIKMRNEKALREYQVEKSYEGSTNFYSLAQYVIDLEAAKNFDELKTVIVKKAKTKQTEAKAKKDKKAK